MKNQKCKTYKSFYGVITPISWDKSNSPKRFSLYTAHGEDLLIDESFNKKKLSKVQGEQVIVEGHVFLDEEEQSVILPRKITKLSGNFGSIPSATAESDFVYPLKLPCQTAQSFLFNDMDFSYQTAI